MKYLISSLALLLTFSTLAQEKCKYSFTQDSCALQNPAQKVFADLMEVKIRNNYQVQLIKNGPKNYLKIIVRDNLGYGQTGSLLLYSNKKQYFTKSITLQVIDKNSAYFLLELNANYLMTLKEDGLTSIIFKEKVEFSIPKQDSEAVKQLATCFSEITSLK